MNNKYRIFMFWALLMLALFLTTSCVTYWGYGEVKPAYKSATIKDLAENWEDYDVTYSGLNINHPAGLMFDPKRDQKKLSGKYWRPVKDRAMLDEIIMWLKASDDFQPRLLRIVGPDKILYGYVYTGLTHVVSRAVDEQTMWVMDLPSPITKERGSSSGL